MLLNILRISASNVLTMLLKIIVNIWCTFVKKIKKYLILYMHNIVGDVALTNISRETNNFHDFCEVSKLKVPRLSSVSICS